MRRALTLLGLAAALSAAVIVILLRAEPDRDAADAATTQVIEVAGVEVSASLLRFDETGASIRLALDTHTGDLGLDVEDAAVLTVGGLAWPGAAWDGDPPGGHHRAGTLRFDAAGPASGTARLDLTGLARPVSFAWIVEGPP